MKVLITGADGQLGYELQRTAPPQYQLVPVDVAQLDITDTQQIRHSFETHQPDIVINAAAYTQVDKAEIEPELANLVNNQGVRNLAKAVQHTNICLIHISTDFVFSGRAFTPYRTSSIPASINMYGATKHAAERAILEISPNNSLIIRTGWLYSSHGHNFVKTMLNLMRKRRVLKVVYDQIGTPTWAKTLAEIIWQLENRQAIGIYHCTNNGIASWYDFAVAIQEEAFALGLLKKQIPIRPISTAEYPTAARRPAYSVMDKSKTEGHLATTFPHWRKDLRKMLQEL